MINDGLTNPFTGKHMMQEASEVGNELEITRPDMDRCATRSHQLAAKATDEGRLAEEIVAVTVKSEKARRPSRSTRRSGPTRSIEALAKLQAVGVNDASHTAGNAPGVNDGAAAVVVASDEWASSERQGAARHGDRATAASPTTSPISRAPPRRPPSSPSRRPAGRPPTSTSGRSTRPSPRSRSTRSGCSASTRTRSTSTAARSRSATRSAPPAAGSWHPRLRAAAPRRRPRLRRDLLRRRTG